jgi:hypothetical protein
MRKEPGLTDAARGCMMNVMTARFPAFRRKLAGLALGAFAALALTAPAMAQDLEKVDPDAAMSDTAIDADLANPRPAAPVPAPAPAADVPANAAPADPTASWSEISPAPDVAAAPAAAATASPPAATADTYGEDDLIGAAEGVFGKGAEGLAKLIEDLLKKQGRPNGYIVGREAGGAFIIGARYGSGTLHHKIEGERRVYWTGPSVGFDAGANAGNTFVLVYNLFDSEDLFNRFPAGEGQAYLVGGLTASYMRRGDVVLIPIRVGAGLRLGINAGYMKFSKEQKWVPF